MEMDYRKIGAELFSLMREDYADLHEFHTRSGIDKYCSRETVRALLHEGKEISHIKLFYICVALGLSSEEIQRILCAVGEKELSARLVATPLMPSQQAIVEFVEEAFERGADKLLIEAFDFIAKTIGISSPSRYLHKKDRHPTE